jgi:hypothetical protein
MVIDFMLFAAKSTDTLTLGYAGNFQPMGGGGLIGGQAGRCGFDWEVSFFSSARIIYQAVLHEGIQSEFFDD